MAPAYWLYQLLGASVLHWGGDPTAECGEDEGVGDL